MVRTCLRCFQVRTNKMVKTSSVWLRRNPVTEVIVLFLFLRVWLARSNNKTAGLKKKNSLFKSKK